jgi:universal stress protein E
MHSVRRILVAVKDPWAASLPAVTKATQLARAFGADLELYHAIDSYIHMDLLGTGGDRARQLQRDERLHALKRLAVRIRTHAVNVTVSAEWDYPAAEAIVRRAHRIGAELIVAERHAGSHVAPGLRGLSDWQLLRLSPVSVLLVSQPRPYRHPTVLTAIDPSHAFAKPAQLDEEILRIGTLLSQGLRGKLHAVHAYLPKTATRVALAAAAGVPSYGNTAAHAKVEFDRALAAAMDVLPIRRHLTGGNPFDAIRRVARRVDANIVVAGAVSRAGLQRLLIGSTAERLLNGLFCDLLFVKVAGCASPVADVRRSADLVVGY